MPNPQRDPRDPPSTRRSLRASSPALLLSAVASRRPATAQAALETLLGRARDLSDEGAVPKVSVERCLLALAPVLKFIASEPALHAEVALSREMCGAVLRIAEEVQGEIPLAPKLQAPLSIMAPQSVRPPEPLRTSALLLEAYRDAVRRALRGSTQAGLRAEFGLGNSLGLTDGKQLADSMCRFLHAAERFPDCVKAAGLQPAQLLGLAAQERVLRAMETQAEQQSTANDSQYRRKVLHLALEYFLERFAAALHLHLRSQPGRMAEGLSLLPGHAQPPRPRSGLSSCQVTDSGRLIFA